MLNAAKAITLVDRAYVYDNSVDDKAPELLYRTVNGVLFKQYVEQLPQWAELLIS